MAFTTTHVFVALDTLTAADLNAIQANINVIWGGSPTAGDIDYYTSATAKNRLGITPGGVLYGGAAAPVWTALGAYGSILYNPSSGVPAWLARGSGYQALLMSSGGVLPEWAASLQSLMTAQGDIVYASAANTPARLAKGTARQALLMNSGATLPEWVASPQSVMTAQGDLLYASAANTLAKLAKGTAYQKLRMNAGATAPEWFTSAIPTAGSFSNDTYYEYSTAAWRDMPNSSASVAINNTSTVVTMAVLYMTLTDPGTPSGLQVKFNIDGTDIDTMVSTCYLPAGASLAFTVLGIKTGVTAGSKTIKLKENANGDIAMVSKYWVALVLPE